MRWITHDTGDGDRVGVLVDGGARLLPPGPAMVDLLGKTDRSLSEIAADLLRDGSRVSTSELVLRAPVPTPPSFRDFLSFEQHLLNTATEGHGPTAVWYEQPVFYFSNPAAFKGPGAQIPVPPGCQQFDYELEVAVIVGRAGADLTPAEAEDCIAGLTILCDWSARDLQLREMTVGLGPAKGKDSSTSMGPWLVSWDEFDDVRKGKGFDLEMRASVNGVPWSVGNLSSLHWSFGDMLAQASRGTYLRPGDVIASGTVGSGCILELARLSGSERFPFLQPGDEVVLEVERLGRLEHTIGPSRPPAWEAST
jgi:2-keto-4-pentenoate hydratase/2-oxohepta-3-ene-1,7-dioic acid hydratase in catechol pathway